MTNDCPTSIFTNNEPSSCPKKKTILGSILQNILSSVSHTSRISPNKGLIFFRPPVKLQLNNQGPNPLPMTNSPKITNLGEVLED